MNANITRQIKVIISISTNPATEHIGRYFVDVRDVTAGRNLQMTTRVSPDPAAIITELKAATEKLIPLHFEIHTVDETGGEIEL